MTDNYLSVQNQTRRPSIEGYVVEGSKYQLIGKYFAAGSFGEVHLGQNTLTGELVAAKLVPRDNPNVQLESEYRFYQMLGQAQGIPKIYHFGECDKYNALVMELLGPSLEKVFRECEHMFSVKTTTKLAIQLMNLMEYIHSRRIIFRNVKPENFCLGRPNTQNANQLYLIGFIHANVYLNEDHEHIPKIKGMPYAGTPRYMSLRTHKGKEQSRRDDLESIGHMLIYFVKGGLPWQGLQANNDAEKYEKIYRVKKQTKLEELCDEMPHEYYHYMLYVRTLKFTHEPNYQYLKLMFIKLLERLGLQNDDVYDWDLRRQALIIESPSVSAPTTPKVSTKKTVSFDMNSTSINE